MNDRPDAATPPSASLDEWVDRLAVELGLPAGFATDIPGILDLARDAAHGVARPAAPLTTFLVGYAAGLSGGGEAEVQRLSEIATALARAASPEHP